MAATVLMVGVPLLVVWVSSQVLYFRLPMVAALVLSLALSLVCAMVVSRIWERRSKTAEISFSESMIWSWYRLQKAERRIEQGLSSPEATRSHDEQLQVLHELTAALESKDPYTRGHSRRVERHSFKTGVALGLTLADVEVLRMAASLHDVGKIRITNKVLHKPGALSEEERALIEEHPVLGAQMVASIHNGRIVEAVRHHHERWDGGGYPQGRTGAETPLFARVIAVADAYDAIRSNRSYRPGASRDEAVQVLCDESGRQFDPEVVEAFLTTLPARGRAVAALTSLATGPAGLWRHLAQLFQRFGATALAPALGVAGTAVIVGSASLLGPAIPALASPVNTDRSPGSSASVRLDASEIRDHLRIAAQARVDRRRAERQQERRAERRQERKGARRQERRTAATASSDSGSSTSPTSSTEQEPAASEPAPATNSSGGAEEPAGDPNDEGKDCKDKRNQSKGSELHCG